MKTVEPRGLDGAHWGITDWYPEFEAGIQEALDAGEDFTTDWYASKKEIASGKVTLENGLLTCEAHVSNDFDCSGHGKVEIPYPATLQAVKDALDKALNGAGQDQKDNCQVCMYTIHNPDGQWVNTYLIDQSEYGPLDHPPGDNYHHWGWEHDTDSQYGPPQEIRERLEPHMSPWAEKSEIETDGWTARRVE